MGGANVVGLDANELARFAKRQAGFIELAKSKEDRANASRKLAEICLALTPSLRRAQMRVVK